MSKITKEILDPSIKRIEDAFTSKKNDVATKELSALAQVISKDFKNPCVEERVNELTKIATRIVRESSIEIEKLCVCDEKDYDAKKMISWGHLRVAALQILTFLVCSEQRCVSLFPDCFDPVLDLLRSKSSKTDFVGTRVACNIARNLVLPLKNRTEFWKAGALNVLLEHGCHKDPNISLAAIVTARQLALNCDQALSEHMSASDIKSCANSIDAFLKRDLKHTHPMVRAEFSRFLALLSVGVSKVFNKDKKMSPLHELFCEPRCIEFYCFLLASKSQALHIEALAALSAMRIMKSFDSSAYVGFLTRIKATSGVSVKGRLDQLGIKYI